MSREFKTYEEAYTYAQTQADTWNLSYGLEKPTAYQGWTVKLIPRDRRKRFGWELRCQAVEPTQRQDW